MVLQLIFQFLGSSIMAFIFVSYLQFKKAKISLEYAIRYRDESADSIVLSIAETSKVSDEVLDIAQENVRIQNEKVNQHISEIQKYKNNMIYCGVAVVVLTIAYVYLIKAVY